MNVIVSVCAGRVRACGVHICDTTTICTSLALSRYRDTDTIIWCLKCMLRIISRTTWPRISNQFWLLLNEEEAPIVTATIPANQKSNSSSCLGHGRLHNLVRLYDRFQRNTRHSFILMLLLLLVQAQNKDIDRDHMTVYMKMASILGVCGVCVCAGNRAFSCSKQSDTNTALSLAQHC